MIARALTSHRDHKPWVMRRRTQAEMDELVAAAGFRKIEQRIDEWGIFTVSLAMREGDVVSGAKAASDRRAETDAAPPAATEIPAKAEA